MPYPILSELLVEWFAESWTRHHWNTALDAAWLSEVLARSDQPLPHGVHSYLMMSEESLADRTTWPSFDQAKVTRLCLEIRAIIEPDCKEIPMKYVTSVEDVGLDRSS